MYGKIPMAHADPEPTVEDMFAHAIVGVDGRDGGRDAAALAQALNPERVTLVTVYPFDDVISRGHVDSYFEVLQKEALDRLARLRDELGLERAHVRAIGDLSPAGALKRVAAEEDAELIIVGSAHHGAVTRLLLGDVGRAVLHGAPCAVAVAPRGYAEREARRPAQVAVGYDASPEGRAALEVAMRSAKSDPVRPALTLVHAWDLPPVVTSAPTYVPNLEQLNADEREAAQRTLDRGLAVAGPTATGLLEHGRPDQVLRDVAERFDLLVVGSRGFGPARRVALGSTSDRLIHRTSIPVVVVPRPAEDASGRPAAAAEMSA